MPRRPSPNSLKSNCLTAVAKNLEILSYGCEKGSAELRDLIDTEYFLQIKGPLFDCPDSLLSDLSNTVHKERAGSKHLLHLIIQPSISRYIIGIAGSLNSTMRLLRERCSKSLKRPFADWPTSMILEMCKEVYTTRSGLKHHIHLVIQPQMESFCVALNGSVYYVMRALKERCANSLRVLDFRANRNLPPHHFVDFFRTFPNLTHIDLCGSIIDDIGINAIAETAKRVIQLNISRTAVTNVGMKNLCFGDDYGQNGIYTYRCPDLILLEVSGTRVTADGISLFIECHRNTLHIEHEESLHCLDLVKQQNDINNSHCNFRITQLQSTNQTLNPELYEYTIDHCPNIRSLTITSPGLTDEHLYKLMQLKNLTKLHLGNKYGINIPSQQNNDSIFGFSFYEGVAPVLNEIGVNLKKLVLEDFQQVDIILIGQLCPKIEHLALSSISSFAPALSTNQSNRSSKSNGNSRSFQHLDCLEIWHDTSSSLVEPVIKSLLFQGSQLRRIVFARVDALNDGILATALPMMLRLQEVVFDHCQNITVSSLWYLLQQPNDLISIQCWQCKLINQSDKDEIKRTIKEENLSVYFEWYPYIEAEEALLEAGYLNLESEDEESDENEEDEN